MEPKKVIQLQVVAKISISEDLKNRSFSFLLLSDSGKDMTRISELSIRSKLCRIGISQRAE